jgi:hypothetical protein
VVELTVASQQGQSQETDDSQYMYDDLQSESPLSLLVGGQGTSADIMSHFISKVRPECSAFKTFNGLILSSRVSRELSNVVYF